ncbi:MAG: glucose-6-phosphate isomerase [Parvibaculaceae bacterium]|nr:glucose-6-phosphate isomerase [Parvibaculaceae bacterium]
MSTFYTQTIDQCFEKQIGAGGLSENRYAAEFERAREAAVRLKAISERDELRLLKLPAEREDLEAMKPLADHLLNNTTDLFVLGIGGSSLGAQALAQIGGWGTQAFQAPALSNGHATRFHFLENPDAMTMTMAMANIDLKTTRFLVISKSGGTAEPLLQMMIAIDALEKAGAGEYLKHHFGVVTEPPKDGASNTLRSIAESYGFPIIEHDPGVGGRYSVFSNVGLLPAYMMGLDPIAIREGAAEVLHETFETNNTAPIEGTALGLGLVHDQNCSVAVLFNYADRLEKLGLWYRQLWAESLGKKGQGTLPVVSLGPTDQHSQLQLYLSGPKDKFYTMITTDTAGRGPAAPAALANKAGLDYLADRTIGDLVDAEQRATYNTLAANGCPTRELRLKSIDEASMGALMMHFMLETILTADLMKINPYNQPAVEEGKILARQYLHEMDAK